MKPLFEQSEILPIKYRVIYRVTIFVYIMIESVFFDVSRDITKLYPVDKTCGQNSKNLDKKVKIDKTMFENFLNDISKLYTSNLVYNRFIGLTGTAAPRVTVIYVVRGI